MRYLLTVAAIMLVTLLSPATAAPLLEVADPLDSARWADFISAHLRLTAA